MKFLRRKVSIFGKAIPISLILLFITAVTALAIFLNIYVASVEITAMSGPDGTLELTSCTIAPGPGTMDTAVLVGQDVTIAASGLANSSVIKCIFKYTPNNGDHLYTYTPPDPLPAGLAAFLSNIPNDTVIAQDVPVSWTITMNFADLQPSQVMDVFEFSLNFADN